MTDIASLVVRIGADASQLQGVLGKTERDLKGVSKGFSLKETGAQFLGLGGSISLAMAPLEVFGALGIQTASRFQDSMSEISVRTGIVGTDLASISDFALQMGADTSFSAQQAADAMLQLLTSGQNTTEAMATLPSVLDAAAASGMGLGEAADAITDIMASFGLEAMDAAAVADSLARAAGASSATMPDLAQGFANVGGKAKAFGLDVKRTAAILAIFSENGIKGAEAGTQLRSMLTMMSSDSKDVQNAWDQLGTSLYTADGQMRDLPDVINDIRLSLAGMNQQDANAVINDIAGSYGELGLRALLGSISIEEMETSMTDAAGAAEVADGKMNTFSGKVSSLQGSVETLMTNAMTPFMDNVLTPMIDKLTPIVNSISDWAKENPELTTGLATLVAIGGGVGAVLTVIGVGASAAAAGFAAMMGPVGLVALGIGALIVGTGLWHTQLTDTITVGDAVGIGMATVIDDMSRRFRIMFLDIEWWTQSAIGLIRDVTGDQAGAMTARLRINEIEVEKGNFSIGDALYTSLLDGTDEFRNGIPFSLPDNLVLQIQNDPASLADSLSLPTKALLIEAWNAAVATGDMDFMSDAMPLIVAIDQSGVVPTWGGGIDMEGVKSTLVTNLQAAIDANDGTMVTWNAIVDLQQMALAAGVDPAVVNAMFANAEIENTLNTGLQTAIDAMSVTGFLDLSKIEIATGSNELDPLTGTWTPQVLPLDKLLTLGDSQALADLITNSGPELSQTVESALRSVLLVGDAYQQTQVINLAEMIGIDTDAFRTDFEAKAKELDLGGDVTKIITDAMKTGDQETIEFIIPLMPLLDYDGDKLRTAIETELSKAQSTGDMSNMQVIASVNFGLQAADEAAIRADSATVITTATEGLGVAIDTSVSPRVTVPGSFRSNVAGILAGQIDGMTIQANVHVIGTVTGVNPDAPDPLPDGSHAAGLDYVPFNGYRAILHKGEAVIPASENRRRGEGQAPVQNVFNVNSYGQSPQELVEWMRRLMREGGY